MVKEKLGLSWLLLIIGGSRVGLSLVVVAIENEKRQVAKEEDEERGGKV